MGAPETIGVWFGSGLLGTSKSSVSESVAKLQDVGFNTLLPNLKDGNGFVHWPCQRFPQATKPGYEDFDLPAVLLEECDKQGMRVHAWFMDYFDGGRSPALEVNPDWAMLNAHGLRTSKEILRGKPFGNVWMCPAQRPGYTDEWLVPLYQEFAERYAFEAIHHDYIRYPGDMAPDQYCFCDYCLEEIPEFASYYSAAYPDEAFPHATYDRPYLEAHWEQSPRVLPDQWRDMARHEKANLLLEGSFFSEGRVDLDYFFYLYRTHQINEFARLSHDAVKTARPDMQISAAVFKNPVHSGRFIGQDWRQFAPYVDVLIPMDYRDHFPGTFEQYVQLLEESIERQQDWKGSQSSLWIGFAINFLFQEERGGPYPHAKVAEVVDTIRSANKEGLVVFCAEQIDEFGVREVLRSALR